MRSLRRLRERGKDWTLATLPRVSQNTWDSLVTLGFVEERLDGEASDQRLLKLVGRRLRESLDSGLLTKTEFASSWLGWMTPNR